MQKKFLTNLGLLLFLNLLVKPFWVLGIDRSVQNAVGAEDFGFYFSILNFSFLFNIFLDLGITNFNNRNIAQNHQLLNKHFSSILILKLLLGVLYVITTFLIGFIIGYDSKQFEMLAWVGFNQFLLSFVLYLRSNISGLLLFKTDSVLSVLDRLLMILFCSILLWGNVSKQQFRIEWFVYAQTAAYVTTMIIALIVVIKKSGFRKLNWNWPFLLMILKKSAPFALLVLLMAQYNRIDTVFIERLLPGKTGDQQAGIYAQAYRLLDAANMIAFLFSVLLLPLFSKMIKLKQSVEDLAKLSFSLLFTISAIVAVASWFYSNEIMNLLYPIHQDENQLIYQQRIDQSALIFSMLMFGFIAISSVYVFGTLLTANGSLKQLNIVAASGVVISIVLNLILVPKLRATGSAYASLSAQYITAIAQAVLVVYLFKFRINVKYLASIIIFIVGLGIIGYYSRLIPLDWIYKLFILVSVAFIYSLVLRLLHIKEFIRILRSEKE
ncbi:MAG: oligosaccharide flippase family protein [Bacteroidales bacterium]|nr:oligosaccharide flippase family protein [Bacteroidales bacterium]MCF8403751.1 oligosaccharide flippase family protein [Bacteroidales bacterium]